MFNGYKNAQRCGIDCYQETCEKPNTTDGRTFRTFKINGIPDSIMLCRTCHPKADLKMLYMYWAGGISKMPCDIKKLVI